MQNARIWNWIPILSGLTLKMISWDATSSLRWDSERLTFHIYHLIPLNLICEISMSSELGAIVHMEDPGALMLFLHMCYLSHETFLCVQKYRDLLNHFEYLELYIYTATNSCWSFVLLWMDQRPETSYVKIRLL